MRRSRQRSPYFSTVTVPTEAERNGDFSQTLGRNGQPVATLPNALGNGTNQIQPDQPFTSGAAGTFGRLTSTVGRTVGLGTNRQMQFALRFNF